MNISQLAKEAQVTTDTVRFYEKQGLIDAPLRQANGYRIYAAAEVGAVRFVRGAQALGFSLAEIRAIQPRLAQGQLGRGDIEQHLQAKIAQIDAHIQQLSTLRQELAATFASLRCTTTQVMATGSTTAPDSGSGAGAAVSRSRFAKSQVK